VPTTQNTAPVNWPAAIAHNSDDSNHSDDGDSHIQDSDTMSIQTTETENQSSIAASPVKKKSKRKSRDSTLLNTISKTLNPPSPPSDQDKSAQYTNPRTPDDGET
jgi:hypothetical protein